MFDKVTYMHTVVINHTMCDTNHPLVNSEHRHHQDYIV